MSESKAGPESLRGETMAVWEHEDESPLRFLDLAYEHCRELVAAFIGGLILSLAATLAGWWRMAP